MVKIGVLYRIGMFISSFLPLYIILFIINYEDFLELGQTLTADITFYTLLFLLVLSPLFLIYIVTRKHNRHRKFGIVKERNEEILSYIVTYIIPLLSMDVTVLSSILANGFLFLLMGFIYVKNNLTYLNPLFLLFNYKLYNNSEGILIISNHTYNWLNEHSDTVLSCKALGDRIFFIRKRR